MDNKKNYMKTVLFTGYGAPEVLQWGEIEKPAPKENEVLIKIHATSVTAGDSRIRSLNVPLLFRLPMKMIFGFTKPRITLGMELAGEIEAVGNQVKRFKTGDQVFASTTLNGFSAYAEYKCLPENAAIALKSPKMTWEEAATLPIGGLTALHFLRKAKIQPGQKVLIYGSSGSVGTYAVQLARHYGAEVTGVCSGINTELVKSLGATKVIDYTKEDFTQNGQTYDVIFDTVGKCSFSGCIRSLTENGVYLQAAATDLSSFLQSAWVSLTSAKKVFAGTGSESSEGLNVLKELFEAGHLKPVIEQVYPLEQITQAHRHVDSGRKKGNIAIRITKKQSTL